MKTLIAVLVLIFCGSITPSVFAQDWPLYFDKLAKDLYILVVLHEDGRAEYHWHQTSSVGNIVCWQDEAATWGYHNPSVKNVPPNIWLKLNNVRLDYYLEESRLTEIDKMGVQNILKKRKHRTHDAKR